MYYPTQHDDGTYTCIAHCGSRHTHSDRDVVLKLARQSDARKAQEVQNQREATVSRRQKVSDLLIRWNQA